MSNPVLTRLRQNLAAGARRAEAEAAASRDRLAGSGATAENGVVRIRVDALGRLLEVRFGPGVLTTTPAGWSSAVLAGYASACRQLTPLEVRPEVGVEDAATPRRPGAAGVLAERAGQLAATLPEMTVEAEDSGVRLSLTGQQRLAAASVSEDALLRGPEQLDRTVMAVWAVAVEEIGGRVQAVLEGSGPATDGGGRVR